MARDIFDLAEKEGFEQGWQDGISGFPRAPHPDIGFDLLQPGYAKHFHTAYNDAYEAGFEERKRREALRQAKSREIEQERER